MYVHTSLLSTGAYWYFFAPDINNHLSMLNALELYFILLDLGNLIMSRYMIYFIANFGSMQMVTRLFTIICCWIWN